MLIDQGGHSEATTAQPTHDLIKPDRVLVERSITTREREEREEGAARREKERATRRKRTNETRYERKANAKKEREKEKTR